MTRQAVPYRLQDSQTNAKTERGKAKRRQDCRRGTQECARHNPLGPGQAARLRYSS
jgi:hypothetical protein